MSEHLCHAKNCTVPVPPHLLMCFKHWTMVPRNLQKLVWRHYRPGQEIEKNPTREYLQAMEFAIEAVALKEAERLALDVGGDAA